MNLRGASMRTLTKYVLLQVPGWALAAVLLVWLWPKTGLSPWIAVAGFAAWVVKDFVLFPFLRSAYEGAESPTGGVRLIGRTGVAREDLDPEGYVAVAGELWRAEVVRGQGPIAGGTCVRITGASGLTLYVVPDREGAE